MSYSEAIQFLYQLQLFGAILGLETTRRLAHLVGNPQDRLRFIHVAGTNGKGSTCAMLESIYRAAGYRVGLYTSPHLVSFAERIQVNRKMIPEADLTRLVSGMKIHLNQEGRDFHPTFFEVVTVLALQYFAEQKCDLVIWETGLGGRLDATNIVSPDAVIITNVAFDHETWLGDTLEKIAIEKAGIIKANIPVISAVEAREAREVISKRALECHAPIRWIPSGDNFSSNVPGNLPLLGEHQTRNAATAIAAVEILQPKFPVPEGAIQRGLSTVDWPGRLQQVNVPGGPTVLLDGAHNPAGVQALRLALQKHFPGKIPLLIFGVMRDKNWKAMCGILAPLARKIIVSPVASERSALPPEVQRVCQEANPDADVVVVDGLQSAFELARRESFVVVTGSLYFVGEAIELLKVGNEIRQGERELNEWTLPSKPGTGRVNS